MTPERRNSRPDRTLAEVQEMLRRAAPERIIRLLDDIRAAELPQEARQDMQ